LEWQYEKFFANLPDGSNVCNGLGRGGWRFDQPFARSVFEAKIPSGAIKADFVELKREVQK
jgi:hypothetical protein